MAKLKAVLLLWLGLPPSSFSAASGEPASSHSGKPSLDAARQNAFGLFNAVHSAMRQWGLSINHNGMSFFLATVPEGSVFYHGQTASAERPKQYEWLAFEIEHASQFARSWDPPETSESQSLDASPISGTSLDQTLLWHQYFHTHGPAGLLTHSSPLSVDELRRRSSHQEILVGAEDDKKKKPPRWPPYHSPMRGYLHMYRSQRPLNLLYLDGEAAAKCPLGTLDSTDLILLGYNTTLAKTLPGWGEWQRAEDLCALAEAWAIDVDGAKVKIDGFARMEAGFEIIYCDFSPAGGLDLVSVQASPFRNETGEQPYSAGLWFFEWLRASAERYGGFPAGRIDVDWSSMVSAFAYPLNLSNPDWERQDLPRVVNASREDRRSVRDRLHDVVTQRLGRGLGGPNWQGIVDMIVSRYGMRLWNLVQSKMPTADMLIDLRTLTDPFTSYLDPEPAGASAVSRCSGHYLDPKLLRPEAWTPEDAAVHASLEAVSEAICSTLFEARGILMSALGDHDATAKEQAAAKARGVIRELTVKLNWTMWKACGKCPGPDEICLIPMFPAGDVEDYFHPKCKNLEAMMKGDLSGYWRRDQF